MNKFNTFLVNHGTKAILILLVLTYFKSCGIDSEVEKTKKELRQVEAELDTLNSTLMTRIITEEQMIKLIKEVPAWKTLRIEEISDKERISINALEEKRGLVLMAVDENSERIAKKFGIITPPNISTPDERPSQINQIFTGWANYVKNKFDILSPEIKVLSESRLLECDACHMRSGHQCDPRKKGKHVKSGNTVNGCGCNIAAKTMSPGSICPLGKW